MFVLLKSTYKDSKSRDILLDTNEVGAVSIDKEKRKDDIYYSINVWNKNSSGSGFGADYETEEEARAVLKEILGNRVSDEDLAKLRVTDRTK